MNWIYITLIVIASLIGVILIYVIVQIIFDEIKKGYFKKECEKSYKFNFLLRFRYANI